MSADSPFVLQIAQATRPPRVQELRAGTYIIGRDPDRADIVLLSGQVSRQHATLELTPTQCSIADRHSKNGIYINGERLRSALLRPRDSIRIGDFTLTLEFEAALLPAAAMGLLDAEATEPTAGEAQLLASAAASAWQPNAAPQDAAWGPTPTAAAPTDDAVDDDVDDAAEPTTAAAFVAPYSLAQLLLQDHRGLWQAADEDHGGAARLELVAMVATEVVDYALLAPGGRGWQRRGWSDADAPQRGLLQVRPQRDLTCLVRCDTSLPGVWVRHRRERDAAQFFGAAGSEDFVGLLQIGDVLHLSHGHETFCLRWVTPPAVAPQPPWLRRLHPFWGHRIPAGVVALATALLLAIPGPPPAAAQAAAPLEFVVATANQLQLRPPPPRSPQRPTPVPVADVISDRPAPRPQLQKSRGHKLVKNLHAEARLARAAPKVPLRRRAAVGVLGARAQHGSLRAPGRAALRPSLTNLEAVVALPQASDFRVSGLQAHAADLRAIQLGGAAPAARGATDLLRGAGGGPGDQRAGQGRGLLQKSGSGVETAGGALDMASIMKVIWAHTDALQACYEAGLQRNRAMAGRVRLAWVIELDGSVTGARVVDSALDSVADSCVVSEVGTWKFPLPHGSPVRVRFPFVTKSIDF